MQFQFLGWPVLCLIGVEMVVLAPEDSVDNTLGWILLHVALGYLFWLLQILPHELGHAFAAHLLGWRVFKIALGQGRNLCRFRCGKVVLEINAIPTLGLTQAASRSARFYRLKEFLFVLAGPLANVALLIPIPLLVPLPQRFTPFPGTKLIPWLAWVGSTLVLLIANLVPYRMTAVLGSVPATLESDGLGLLTAFSLTPAIIRQRQAQYFLLEGVDSYRQGDHQAAKQWHEQGLELLPDDIPNRFHLAYVLLFLKEFHASRAQWLLLLERNDLPPALRMGIVDNLAWTNLVIGDKESLVEADRLSQEAIQEQPWHPPFQGTRGSVLIELGEADKGLPLVRQAFAATDDPRLKALHACYLALGECQHGNRLEAQHQRDLAQKLDPECFLLNKVDQSLTAVSASV